MCEKCKENPGLRHTRYCDDWWDDSSHGGYKADRKYKEDAMREKKQEETENKKYIDF